MDITRNVILDLLPLYIADEVSADTRALVEAFLESDPELADMAERAAQTESVEEFPVPLTPEDKMKAYSEAKRLMFWRTVILAAIIAVTLLALLAFAGVAVMFLIGSPA